jgi:hypothetical protein
MVPQLVEAAAPADAVELDVALDDALAAAVELELELDEQAARPRPAVRASAAAAAPPVDRALIYVSFDY